MKYIRLFDNESEMTIENVLMGTTDGKVKMTVKAESQNNVLKFVFRDVFCYSNYKDTYQNDFINTSESFFGAQCTNLSFDDSSYTMTATFKNDVTKVEVTIISSSWGNWLGVANGEITDIYIPSTVMSISDNAFSLSYQVEMNVHYDGTVQEFRYKFPSLYKTEQPVYICTDGVANVVE